MKKRLTIFLITLLALLPLMGMWPLNVQAAYVFSGGGEGTPGNPYMIETAEDLDHIRDNLTSSYKLQADINLSSYGNWNPIGTDSNPFEGNFDGAGYTISGMIINSSADSIGLFGFVNLYPNKTIKHVRLENVDITSTNVNAMVGGLIGLSAQGTIDGCSVIGEIDGVAYNAGGLIGQLSSTGKLINSASHVQLNMGRGEVGGLVGLTTSGATIDQSYATGDVSNTGSGSAGGLVGHATTESILNSYATGDVTAVSNASIGGLVGSAYGTTVINSYATGIMSPGTGSVGGLVGRDTIIGILVITSSYWNLSDNLHGLQTIGGTTGTGGAVSKSAMKQMATYVGWNPAIWGIQPGVSYPYLKAFSPTLRVGPLSPTYSTKPGVNQLTVSGYVRDSSIGEPLVVSYTIKNASNYTVTQDVYATNATSGDQSFNLSTVLDESIYTVGTYTIDITVKDTVAGHEQLKSLTFAVVDTTAPLITLNGSNPMQIAVGSTFTDPGATAQDMVDGDLTGQIMVSGSVNTNLVGTYTLTYRVSDAAGNTAATTRTVNVVDSDMPLITILGPNPMQVEAGSIFTDPGATALDVVDGDLTAQITVSGSVYTNLLGAYTLSYSVTDRAGNRAPDVVRTVQVKDTVPPVITLLGESSLSIRQGTPFLDPGATAVDRFDGNLTSQITVTGSVYSESAGTYTLVYKVQDSSGNAAAERVRTVNVEHLQDSTSSGGQPSVTQSRIADLAQLNIYTSGKVLGLSPAYTPGTMEYTAETDAEQVELQLVPAHSKAIVKWLDERIGETITVPLAMGTNVLVITVQAEDGTFKTYTITVNRKAASENTAPPALVCAFTDIQNHWAKPDICEAAGLGIVEGIDAQTMVPDGYVTRTEFAVMLLRTLQIDISNGASAMPFSDEISIPVWARLAIQTAVAKGTLEGYPDGTLRPHHTVIRTEMAAMVSKIMKWEADNVESTSFSDDARIPAWAKAYVENTRRYGLLVGREGNQFVPDGLTTRAEAAVVLLRLWKVLH